MDPPVAPRLVLPGQPQHHRPTLRCLAGRPERPRRDRRAHRRRTMSRCQRKMVPEVTISRIAARRSIGTVPASSDSHARSGHVNLARVPGLPRSATASWCRSIKISASFHHDSRRDNPSSDTARDNYEDQLQAHKPKIIPSRVQPSSRRTRDETDPRPSGRLPRWHRFSAPTVHREENSPRDPAASSMKFRLRNPELRKHVPPQGQASPIPLT